MDSKPGLSKTESGRCLRPRKKCKTDDKPEPSKTKSSSRGRPRKKCKTEDVCCKTENENDVVSQGSSANINDLPNEMLINIFSYLSIPEKLKVEKVCNKWYHLARSKVLWKNVKLSNISESLFIEVLASLPPCVLHLDCGSEKEVLMLPISLPELMAQLHRQCPSLNTLILRNMKLLKVHHYSNYVVLTLPNIKEFDSRLFFNAKNKLNETASNIIKTKFPKEETIELHDAVLPELKILSLRKVMFNMSHFYSHISATVLPNISVLDLSYTQSGTSESISNSFSPLSALQELHLGAWCIGADYIFLKYLKKLRILDLEGCILCIGAVSALEQNCTLLEELYLCRTNIEYIHKTSKVGKFFPRLQSLCVRGTVISRASIVELLTTCPSLKFINVNCCKYITKAWYEDLCKDFKEKLYFDSNKPGLCKHFLNKFALNGTK